MAPDKEEFVVVRFVPTSPTPFLHNKQRPTIFVYATVSPETVVVPIVSCILGFPLLALMVICCLRRRAKLARERDRRRVGNCGSSPDNSRVTLMNRLGAYLGSPGEGRSDRSLSRGYPSLDLDTVVEERSDLDLESTAVEIFTLSDS